MIEQKLIVQEEVKSDLPIYRAAGENPFFKVDPGLALWTWVVFFALLGILYRFAWKPILKVLDEREGRIKNSLDEANRIEEEVRATSEKSETILKEARIEAKKIIQMSREMAEKNKLSIKKLAETESAEILEKARLVIDEEKQKAISRLREESARLGIEIATKLMEENLDDEKNRHLAKKYLDQIAS